MIVAGGWYPLEIPIGFIPLILFMKGSSNRLRANFQAVVAAQKETAMLAKRLDMALNNMSHGLVMVDAEDRLTVANNQFLHLFGLCEEDVQVGADLRAILRKLVRNKVVARTEIERVWQALFHNSREERLRGSLRDRRQARDRDHGSSHEGRGRRRRRPGRDRTAQRGAGDRSDGAHRPRHRASQSAMLRGRALRDAARARPHAQLGQCAVSRSRRLQAGQRQSRSCARRQIARRHRQAASGDRSADRSRGALGRRRVRHSATPGQGSAADGGARRARSSGKSAGRCSSTATK